MAAAAGLWRGVTRIEGRRRIALAHLLPDGLVDPAWRACDGTARGRRVSVNVLALSHRLLYVSGAFGRLGGLARPGLGAVAAASGAVNRS
jgi:hypothetical protein